MTVTTAKPGERSGRILILGGTTEARAAAEALIARGHDVVTSLAGVTRHPHEPRGKVRKGGFGGVEGLEAYIRDNGIALLADATHPFAAVMSAHAVEAADRAGIPCIRLERPAWEPRAGDRWMRVPDIGEAAEAVPQGARVFLTIGRKEIAPFVGRPDLSGLARMIEAPESPLPASWTLLLARAPFLLEDERSLMKESAITVLVTKNSGGQTEAKLEAARALGVLVVMIERPTKPPTQTANDVEGLVRLIEQA
ncbi:MAG: cobalt-precorrin-6A reductase [Parvibaculaceae bacterium]